MSRHNISVDLTPAADAVCHTGEQTGLEDPGKVKFRASLCELVSPLGCQEMNDLPRLVTCH